MNLENFMNKAKELGSNVTGMAMKYVPTALSPDKKLANGFAAALALMICADHLVEDDETIAGMHFIRSQTVLRSRGIVVDTIDFYSMFVKNLMEIGSGYEFVVQSSRIIEEHIAPLDAKSKLVIQEMVNVVCGGQANSSELVMKQEIENALK